MNLVLVSVHLVAFGSLNESIILFISFGYVGVKKKELIMPVSAVAFVSMSTLGMVSAIFFPMLAKYALRFSEIAAGLITTSPVLVLSWLMSICCEGLSLLIHSLFSRFYRYYFCSQLLIHCRIFVSLFQSFDLKQYDTFYSFCILFYHMFYKLICTSYVWF